VRLEKLTPDHVRRAIAVYVRQAWRNGGRPRVSLREIEEARTLPELLARFEQGADSAARECKRYTLRLGNNRYPFMKFVVQEYLVNGEYFFSVDTHDNLEIRPDAPDHDRWEELKVWNRELKDEIETAWHEAGLPTNADLRCLVEGIARAEPRPDQRRARLLLVDDERDIALGLRALLRARGYEVEIACDGREALGRLELDPLPDLVLLDFEMPELDGEAVLERMRASERLAEVPVLVATASNIELGRLRRISGFLRKPYPRQVLFAMIERLLGGGSTPPAPPAT
jgi:CheY-like chemotaxis protein